MRNTQTSKVALDILQQFPKTSKRALAEMLFSNYPQLFNSLEHARSAIKLNSKGLVNNFSDKQPFGFNYSKSKERQFLNIPTVYDNILWLSDIHFPNHDIPSLNTALQYGIDNKINCIVLGGDILDNEPFTNHDAPPPSKNDVIDWFDMAEDFLDMLNEKFPKAKKYWLE